VVIFPNVVRFDIGHFAIAALPAIALPGAAWKRGEKNSRRPDMI
jgi:hypothetical protein